MNGSSGGGGSICGPLGRAAAGGGCPDSQKPLAGSGSLAMAAIPPGAESDAAAALAAVLAAANKMLSSNNDSTASASVDASGAVVTAAAVALAAAYERARSEKALGTGAQAATSSVPVAPDTSRSFGPLGDINAVKRSLMAGRPTLESEPGAPLDELVLQSVLDEGSYGRVYRALWRGTPVAVKVILLPAHMSGRERHERMAVMEAAISSSLSHPNIVQTYTYGVERVEGAKGRQRGRASCASNSALTEASTNPLSGGPGGQPGGLSAGAQGGAAEVEEDVVGWEIRLVQEYCDLGSLRDKLNARAFFKTAPPAADTLASSPQNAILASPLSFNPPPPPVAVARWSNNIGMPPQPPHSPQPPLSPFSSECAANAAAVAFSAINSSGGGGSSSTVLVDLAAVLDTALDVARALDHLHREGIVHADLKPRNVLLKGSTTDPRGFVAKVADFGLSMRLDEHQTHVSNAYHGTLAYMAPETLMHGQVSRASDVYGFGIMLYELYTADIAFRGVPKALLGHAIAKENLRPIFPCALGAPFEYQLLACRCWESNPEIRPDFCFIYEDLKRMRVRLCAPVADSSSAGSAACGYGAAGGAAGAGPSRFAALEADAWGLPQLVHHTSQQGLAGVLPTWRPGAGRPTGCSAVDHSLSSTSCNSLTMTVASASAIGTTVSGMPLGGGEGGRGAGEGEGGRNAASGAVSLTMAGVARSILSHAGLRLGQLRQAASSGQAASGRGEGGGSGGGLVSDWNAGASTGVEEGDLSAVGTLI